MIYCGDIDHVRSIDIIDHLGDTNRFRDSTPKYPSASDVFSDVKKEITKEYKDFTKTIKKQSQLKAAKDYYISLLSGIKTLESFDSYEITSHCNIKQSVEDSVFGKINDKESALEAELN
ncbi:hypothetical protein AA0473_0983 [Acetobacter orleanensis NRIC 0473]|uniref:Uncharacterized protein n=1 Tax=Acetobacter orleanensis TaxID=104099 RepID=A0A4Y3TLJ0_9PROT|nr:hypothetical protein CO710_07520 [Acetobacter orleanensis]GAN69122.1 hypothetical protein Abol_026_024 [Acetobacter orleanensis JCM 7639]GBR25799.1 hypothetical protein AA0473_0983 [Acetobacter orleanensis NRIC 0473]GEB82613.1 hypothetical protein AOR01nite_10900 [Acetobacter orleanensis]